METILIIFCFYGLNTILHQGTILDKSRNFLKRKSSFFDELFECTLCLGFWSGLITLMGNSLLGSLFVYPFASAGVCYLLYRVVDTLDDIYLTYFKEK